MKDILQSLHISIIINIIMGRQNLKTGNCLDCSDENAFLKVSANFISDNMHKIRIVYCVPCGHLQRAEAMKAVLERKGAHVELVPGDKGIHDIYVDGLLVFSRHKEGRFPEEKEILEMIK